jgi:hypothetical protein
MVTEVNPTMYKQSYAAFKPGIGLSGYIEFIYFTGYH